MSDVLATVCDYDDLIEGLRARKAALGLANTVLDDLAGFNEGYTGKLLGGTQIKRLGPISLGPMLNALAVKLVLVEDLDAAERMAILWERRAENQCRAPAEARIGKRTLARVWGPVLREQMRLVREARQAKLSPRRRRQIARNAARIRWQRTRQRSRRRRVALAEKSLEAR